MADELTCDGCGAAVPMGDRFCGECGKEVGARKGEPVREGEQATTRASAATPPAREGSAGTHTPAGWYPAPDGSGGSATGTESAGGRNVGGRRPRQSAPPVAMPH